MNVFVTLVAYPLTPKTSGAIVFSTRMQRWGLNTYLYGPKDDLKHRLLWREVYSPEEEGKGPACFIHLLVAWDMKRGQHTRERLVWKYKLVWHNVLYVTVIKPSNIFIFHYIIIITVLWKLQRTSLQTHELILHLNRNTLFCSESGKVWRCNFCSTQL